MKNRSILIAVIATAAVGAAGFGLYMFGMQRGMGMASAPAAGSEANTSSGSQDIAQGEAATRRHIDAGIKAGDVDPATGKKILYYHDPMVPGKKFDKPAKSPFMDMMLVPVYAGADAGADTGSVTISPRVQQSLGMRTAQVDVGEIGTGLRAVGQVAWNERDQSVVSARATGYVERAYVRATLDRVRAGQAIADVYVPEWVAAQDELLSLKAMRGSDLDSLIDAARSRMRQAGMTDEQIAKVEASGQLQPRVAIVAPQSGVVTELTLREGQTVMAGMPLARIAGLSTVWVEAEVPETQAALVRPGARVQGTMPALPGEMFKGQVATLLPQVNATTRTIRARFELANPKGKLTPGLFVNLDIAPQAKRKVLRIPSEAIIATGERFIVMLAEDDGRFRPVEIEPGLESGGFTEVRSGLNEGQKVVASGQFLIDSESSLRAAVDRFAAGNAAKRTHTGDGRIDAVRGDTVTLTHGPIESMKWGQMTMDFKLPAGGLPPGVKSGDAVRFEFIAPGDDMPRVTRIERIAKNGMPAGVKP